MITPFTKELLDDTDHASRLKRQYEEHQGVAVKSHPKGRRNQLFIPFLLTIPVIIIAFVVTLVWSADDNVSSAPANESTIVSNNGVQGVQTAATKPTPIKGALQKTVGRTQSIAASISRSRTIDEVVTVADAGSVGGSTHELDLTNLTATMLDLVVLEVYHLDKIGKAIRKETLYARNIAPHKKTRLSAKLDRSAQRMVHRVSLLSAKDANLYLVSR
ncbi:MAG: hypothetical protein K0Q66_703 [Chitinophagaceae bacterium]|jgi:hypothetical protein|nr:hypothetical protein [Chitinophagaceae bacterium]